MNCFYKKIQSCLLMLLLLSSIFCIGQQLGSQTALPDYTSKVPRFSFSNSLEAQEAELKNNPLLLRFADSRKKLASDKYRPIYHYINPEGNLNDPNGLCYWNGNWHLFYQAYPPEDPRQHWGHAISKDLVHWKDLPYAIYPNPERAVYSGSTFVDGNRVIAMYHGAGVGNMVAVSNDPLLLNWEKVTGKPVIPIRSTTGFPLPYNVFDPSIWKKDSIYYSLSAGRTPTGPGGKEVRADFLFRSKDLAVWEYMHEFVEGDRFTLVGDDGACPYFWPIGNRYIMPFFSHMSGGQYLLGDYDKQRDKFIVTSHGKFNHGAVSPGGVHAPSATPDGKGGVIILFNMNPAKQTVGWNQIMTLPRLLTLAGPDELNIEPAGDIESLRYNHQHVGPVNLVANKEMVLDIKGNAMEIIAEFDTSSASQIEVNLLRSPKKEEFTRIAVYRERGYSQGRANASVPGQQAVRKSVVVLDPSYSSQLSDVRSRPPEEAQVLILPNEPLKLRIFIDKTVVEVFVNGKQALATRVYPGRNESVGLSLLSQGKNTLLKSLDVWQMKNIYQ
jgi:beta-fructofuranosidase